MDSKLYDKAMKEYKNKNFNAAIKTLSGLSGTASKYYELEAQIFYEQQELSKALQNVEQCIKLEKTNFKVMALKCRIYIKMMNIEAAEKSLSELEEINPKYESLNELKKIISDTKTLIEEEKKKYPQIYQDYLNYLKVLYAGGAFFKSIELKFHTLSYRSAVTTEPIKNGEVFLRIPPELFISLEMARESPLGKQITPEIEKKLNSPHHSILATFFLSELDKGEDSKWNFYFKLLPKDLNNFPIFYGENELNLLKGTTFIKTLEERKKEMLQDYNLLCEKIPDYRIFSYDDFKFYRMITASRIFGVTIKGKSTDIVVPYADMLNHKEPRETHWTYNNKENVFVVNAEMDLPVGREVFYSYGRKCNSRFLLNYGFTIENNEDNEFRVVVRVNKDYKMYESIKYKKFNLRKSVNNKEFNLFISFLRMLCDDHSYDDDCKKFIEAKSNPISKDNEFAVLSKIKNIFSVYADYASTLSEDYSAVSVSNLSFNEKNCYIMRISEKEIIKFYLDLYDAAINFFSMSKEAYQNAMNDYSNQTVKMYKEYLQNLSPLFN